MDKAPASTWENLGAPTRPKILRVLAWISVVSLIVCWGSFAFAFFGRDFPASGYAMTILLLSAFVIGLSSCERMGGIVAALATLSLIAVLYYGIGGASC